MILKASQRGGAKQLARHLTRLDDNDHVELHEIRGFLSIDILGALKEAQAVSQGTKCKQFLFSVSLSPPQNESVGIEIFEDVVERVEKKNGLTGHPRVVVFHEKNGRRHAHAVWSRIDALTMTAKNLSHFKLKLRDISLDLYRENGWLMPLGLIDHKAADPRNFTLAEWQQAKRHGLHAGDQKAMIQNCWAASDSRASFSHALEERGYRLARGDKGGHVAVSWKGQVLPITRATKKRVAEVTAKLGDPADLPNVEEVIQQAKADLGNTFTRMAHEVRSNRQTLRDGLNGQIEHLVQVHRNERAKLDAGLEQRWQAETQQRAARFRHGIKGLWDRMTGRHATIRRENETEAHAALIRDRKQRQSLIDAQLVDRQTLHQQYRSLQRDLLRSVKELKQDRNDLQDKLAQHQKWPKRTSPRVKRSRRRGQSTDIEM